MFTVLPKHPKITHPLEKLLIFEEQFLLVSKLIAKQSFDITKTKMQIYQFDFKTQMQMMQFQIDGACT